MRSIHDLRLSQEEDWNAFNDFRKKRSNGFKTGITEFDAQIRGLTGVVGIQGSPGSCKSTLALQLASYNAENGIPVLFIDRENGRHRLKSRLISQVFGVSSDEVEKASEEQVVEWFHELAKLDLYAETQPVGIQEIRYYVSQLWEVYQKPIVVVVDSLQAMPPIDGMDERMSLQFWMSAFDQLKLDYEGKLMILVTIEKVKGQYDEANLQASKGTNSIGYKCELVFDIRRSREPGLFLVSLVKARDGAVFDNTLLRQVLGNPQDPFSFLYRLEYYGKVEESY